MGIRWVFPEPGGLTPLAQGKVLLGRGADCTKRLPGSKTSRHHASIEQQGVVWVLRDLGSTNGVYVNGRKVADHALSFGDLIRLGHWLGVVVEDGPLDAPEAAPFFEEAAPGLWVGPVLRSVFDIARRAAVSDLPLVLEGETGTGKERFARAIHHESNRPGQFVAVNCAALPEAMAEAELFGYRVGAFTGASRPSQGLIRAAHKGTLLLDEILDLPLVMQAKLLRALEAREITPLGETKPVSVDLRVLAATQRPLATAVDDGSFRADLFARLDGVVLHVPPLRERIEEVAPLFLHFLREHSGGLTPDLDVQLVERLCQYPWPYNVRELELTARRLLTLHGHRPKLCKRHLPESMTEAAAPVTREPGSGEGQLDRLVSALEKFAGNLARASASIGISRQRGYRLLRANDIDLARFRRVSHEQPSR